MSSPFSGSLDRKGFSLPSFGRRDSVEPLFFSDGAGGRSFSVNRASSICRLAICPLSSSRRAFHSGTELQSVPRASKVEKFVAIVVSGVGGENGGAIIRFKMEVVSGRHSSRR